MTRKYFGTDGIRDVAGSGLLTADLVCSYGRAVGSYLREQVGASERATVLIGRDTRESGPTILRQLSQGILEFGHRVVDGGVLTTPAVQTLCR